MNEGNQRHTMEEDGKLKKDVGDGDSTCKMREGSFMINNRGWGGSGMRTRERERELLFL